VKPEGIPNPEFRIPKEEDPDLVLKSEMRAGTFFGRGSGRETKTRRCNLDLSHSEPRAANPFPVRMIPRLPAPGKSLRFSGEVSFNT